MTADAEWRCEDRWTYCDGYLQGGGDLELDGTLYDGIDMTVDEATKICGENSDFCSGFTNDGLDANGRGNFWLKVSGHSRDCGTNAQWNSCLSPPPCEDLPTFGCGTFWLPEDCDIMRDVRNSWCPLMCGTCKTTTTSSTPPPTSPALPRLVLTRIAGGSHCCKPGLLGLESLTNIPDNSWLFDGSNPDALGAKAAYPSLQTCEESVTGNYDSAYTNLAAMEGLSPTEMEPWHGYVQYLSGGSGSCFTTFETEGIEACTPVGSDPNDGGCYEHEFSYVDVLHEQNANVNDEGEVETVGSADTKTPWIILKQTLEGSHCCRIDQEAGGELRPLPDGQDYWYRSANEVASFADCKKRVAEWAGESAEFAAQNLLEGRPLANLPAVDGYIEYLRSGPNAGRCSHTWAAVGCTPGGFDPSDGECHAFESLHVHGMLPQSGPETDEMNHIIPSSLKSLPTSGASWLGTNFASVVAGGENENVAGGGIIPKASVERMVPFELKLHFRPKPGYSFEWNGGSDGLPSSTHVPYYASPNVPDAEGMLVGEAHDELQIAVVEALRRIGLVTTRNNYTLARHTIDDKTRWHTQEVYSNGQGRHESDYNLKWYSDYIWVCLSICICNKFVK